MVLVKKNPILNGYKLGRRRVNRYEVFIINVKRRRWPTLISVATSSLSDVITTISELRCLDMTASFSLFYYHEIMRERMTETGDVLSNLSYDSRSVPNSSSIHSGKGCKNRTNYTT